MWLFIFTWNVVSVQSNKLINKNGLPILQEIYSKIRKWKYFLCVLARKKKKMENHLPCLDYEIHLNIMEYSYNKNNSVSVNICINILYLKKKKIVRKKNIVLWESSCYCRLSQLLLITVNFIHKFIFGNNAIKYFQVYESRF